MTLNHAEIVIDVDHGESTSELRFRRCFPICDGLTTVFEKHPRLVPKAKRNAVKKDVSTFTMYSKPGRLVKTSQGLASLREHHSISTAY